MNREQRSEIGDRARRSGVPATLSIKLGLFLLLLHIFSAVNISAQTAAQSAAAFYERGRSHMADENWYSAVESLLEAARLNPAHAQAVFALAECYYELAEFDEALTWARKARQLSRGNMSAANLEAFALIALGQLDAASALVAEVLRQEPYNMEALFAAGELDIARARPSEALARYREAARRYPDDRRLLISLALVTISLGDAENAVTYINSALKAHSDDYRVYYFAAYIYSQAGRLEDAIRYADRALHFRPQHEPSLSLMATLRYKNGQFEESIRLCDLIIERNRENGSAWYLKGLSLTRLLRFSEAIAVLSSAIAVNEDDEFIRAILEDVLLSSTNMEDPRRARWASWHFEKARYYSSSNMPEQALFEYRRGLRLNPFAQERREYAEILRIQGYPARYLDELNFIQDQGRADRNINDAVETYSALLSNALFKQWRVDPFELTERHWKIAVFSLAGQSSYYHADAGAVAASVARELLIHDRNITPINNLDIRQPSFSQAFRQARENGADYFLIVSVSENERDISIKGDLYAARTGSAAGTFQTYRTGTDRLRNASKNLIDQVSGALPLRGKLLIRRQNQGLINKGKADGIRADMVFDIVKKGGIQISNEGIGVIYNRDELVGQLRITNVDEEIAIGAITYSGFFDRIEPNDEVIFQQQRPAAQTARDNAANPELRALLRTLR